MNDRIPCLNPRCGCTFARKPEHTEDSEICCRKCWKLVPKRLTDRYRALRSRDRKCVRLLKKTRRVDAMVHSNRMHRLLAELMRRNWADIHNFFHAPEKPEGLDNFIEEIFG